eukprot:2302169-Pyramimonas_sp.AAC.1
MLLDGMRSHAAALADSRSLHMVGYGALYPGLWRSPAIVENLAQALGGPAPAGPWASLLPRAREALADAAEAPPG